MDTSHGWAAATAVARHSRAIALALLLSAWCVGCRTNPMNPFPDVLDRDEPYAMRTPDDGEYATSPLDPESLSTDDWVEQPPRSYTERTASDRRWRHRALERHLHPSAPRRDLKEELSSEDAVVATNAAIVTAHWGGTAPITHLVAAVRAERLSLPMRSAAAEALGQCQRPSPATALRKLLGDLTADTGQSSERSVQPAHPDLHADLLRSLARHAEAGDEQWFTAAVQSPAWQVRLEGVAGWTALADAGLKMPEEAIRLRADRDPRVRTMAVRSIAAHRGPGTVDYLKQALADSEVDVRTAAMTGLAGIGTADAHALLAGLQQTAVDVNEVAATVRQSVRELPGEAREIADEAQMQLRLAVAETLDRAEQRGLDLAAETTASTRQAVRQATAEVAAAADTASQQIAELQRRVVELREQEKSEAARQAAAAALEKLAMDADVAVRAQAARTMGQLADPTYVPILVAMLSDDGDVQLAAMASLATIAGTDVAAVPEGLPAPSIDDKVRMWQLWYRAGQSERP